MSRLTGFLRNVVGRSRVERDLDEELGAYLDLIVTEKKDGGLSPEEARRAALIQLGGLEQVKERVREARTGSLVDQLRQDLAYGARLLRRNPSFTAVAVATIALGIGAGTAVFSIVDTVVFRGLPYADPDGLVRLCGTDARDRSCDDDFSAAELRSLREQNDVFEQIAADDGFGATMTRPDGSRESAGVGLVSTNWLATLGVRPQAGRDFTPEEEEPGRDRVVILTDDFWRRRFDRDRNVLGTTLVLDGEIHTIVGVLPPNVLRSYADLLKPLVLSRYSETSLDLPARLKPGVSAARANAAVAVIADRSERSSARNPGRRFGVEPLGKDNAGVDSKTFPGLLVMLAAVGLVLLISCANVANLLLARASARRRECLVRAALGASRTRLLRQFLVEGLLLFGIGGAVGVLAARLSLDSLASFAVSGGYLPERMAVTVDLRVMAVSLLVSLLTGLGFGLIPALQASAVSPLAGRARRRGRMTRRLIVIELAMAVVLLAGFLLLFRSVERLYAISAGFDPGRVLITGSDAGRSFPEAMSFWRAALARAREVPGVVSVAVTSRPPLHGARRQHFLVEGQPSAAPEAAPEAGDILISEDYFRTLGIAIVKGRGFDRTDNEASRPVAVISETLARRYFPDRSPIGSRVRVLERAPMTCCTAPGPVDGVWREVVGVVADVRQANLDEPPAATLYRPYSQIVEHDMFLVARTGSAAQSGRIANELQSRLDALDATREWWPVRGMSRVIRDSESIRLRRFVLILLGGFATVALLLAAIGVYGVASGAIAERTHEIGVRIALGATSPAIFRELVGEMMALAAAGLALGCAGTVALVRLIRAMLFGVGAADPATFAGVTLVLAGVVFAAASLPARRATRVDPLTALRHE